MRQSRAGQDRAGQGRAERLNDKVGNRNRLVSCCLTAQDSTTQHNTIQYNSK